MRDFLADAPPLRAGSSEIGAERRASEEARAAYLAARRRLEGKHRRSRTRPGVALHQAHVEVYAQAIARLEYHPRTMYRWLKDGDPHVIAAVALAVILDHVPGKWNTIAARVGREVANELMAQAAATAQVGCGERMERVRRPHGRLAMARKWLKYGLFEWSTPVRAEVLAAGVALLTLACEELGIVVRRMDGRIPWLHMHEDALRFLTRADSYFVSKVARFVPMLEPPADWGPGQPGGYRTKHLRKPLIRVQRPSHVRRLEEADMPEVYEAVNIAQATAWRVNPDVREVLRELWDQPCTALPNPEPLPMPKPDGTLETHRAIVSTLLANQRREGLRLMAARIRDLALEYEELWFPHHLDWRGRLYPTPPYLNYQGHDLARGLLEFATPCRVQDATLWRAHGEELWGGPFDDDFARAIARDPLENNHWQLADSPWQFLAFALDYGAWLDDPDHPVRQPVRLDGTCNGLQVYALLMRDQIAAREVNVSPGPRADIYTAIASATTARLEESADPDARLLLDLFGGTIPRSVVKRPVMTLPYSATLYHTQEVFRQEIYDRILNGAPWPSKYSAFNAGNILASVVWEEIKARLGSAITCMGWLQEIAKLSYRQKKPICWTTPLGFPVTQEYQPRRLHRIKTYVRGTLTYASRHVPGRGIDNTKQRNGVAPNFVHSLDAAAMMRTIIRLRDQGITSVAMVHDSFGVPAAHGDTLARELREAYIDIFSRDLLTELHREVSILLEDVPPPPKTGDLDITTLRHSEHFFR